MSTTYQFTRQSLAKKPTRHINMGISGEMLAQTICDETVPAGEIVKRCVAIAEMTVGRLVIKSDERFYLVAVAAVSPYFPHRFFVVVCRDGEYLCSRELPKVARIAIDLVEAHRQARREASVIAEAVEVVKVADSKQVTSEVTTSQIETLSARIPAGTKIYRVAGQVLFFEGLFNAWFCTCQETMYGCSYGECEHSKTVQTSIAKEQAEIRFLEAPERMRRGYLTREPGVRRDAVAQTIIVQDGFYTVSWADTHRTFRIETQPADARFAAGKRIIALLGKDGRYTSFAFVERNGELNVWRRFISCYAVVAEAARFLLTGDLASAGKMYAQQSGNCYRCGRVLTTPESLEAGIGPVCAARG